MKTFFFHFHEIVEGLYFHCSLSVCVCLSVRLYSCEQISSQTDAPILTRTDSDTIEIGNIGSKAKVTVTEKVYEN